MDLSMSILQYHDYCTAVHKNELDAICEELKHGTYQKQAISEYKKKYSLTDRMFGNPPEKEIIEECKNSIKHKKKYGAYGSCSKIIDIFHHKIVAKTSKMCEDYEKCFLNEILEKSKSCDKILVKNIVDRCYNQFETEYKKHNSYYLCITDTFFDGTGLEVPLSSLGINPVSGKFEQAGLTAAVLEELRQRYKAKFNEKLRINMSYDSADMTEFQINDYIKKGIYKQGKSYITLCVEKKDWGFEII